MELTTALLFKAVKGRPIDIDNCIYAVPDIARQRHWVFSLSDRGLPDGIFENRFTNLGDDTLPTTYGLPNPNLKCRLEYTSDNFPTTCGCFCRYGL